MIIFIASPWLIGYYLTFVYTYYRLFLSKRIKLLSKIVVKKILFIILIFPNILYAAEFFQPLNKQDIILQSIFTIATIIDWAQTKIFVSKGIRETNVVLTPYPSQVRIDNLISAGIISHAFITYAIPIEYRQVWQSVFIGAEFAAVCINYNNGHGLDISEPICQNLTIKVTVKF